MANSSTCAEDDDAVPMEVRAAVIGALLRVKEWRRPIKARCVCDLLRDAIAARGPGEPIDVLPLFRVIAHATSHGAAANCVREIASACGAAGIEAPLPRAVRRRTLNPGGVQARTPCRRCATGTSIHSAAPLALRSVLRAVIDVVTGAVRLAARRAMAAFVSSPAAADDGDDDGDDDE